MSRKLKIAERKVRDLMEKIVTPILKERGHKLQKIKQFRHRVNFMGAEEVYRPIILWAFLEKHAEELVSRKLSFLFKAFDNLEERKEKNEETDKGKNEESPDDIKNREDDFEIPKDQIPHLPDKPILCVVPKDLRRYLITNLILISRDSLKNLFPDMKVPESGKNEKELWKEIGETLSKEVFKKCLRNPPTGYTAKKVGKGWLFWKSPESKNKTEEKAMTENLSELFLELALPEIRSRIDNLYSERDSLKKEVREQKKEYKKILEKMNVLEDELKRIKREKLKYRRKLRRLKKSNKKMRRRLKTMKDEDSYDHMYG